MRIFFFLFLSLLWGCAGSSPDESPTGNAEQKRILAYPTFTEQPKLGNLKNTQPKDSIERTLEAFYQQLWLKNGVSGGLLVAKNGAIIFEKYLGYENFLSLKKMKENSPLHLASISKVLTSLAILKLAEHQLLRLDEPVMEVLPDFIDKNITIRNLLSHRSGLQNYAYFQPDEKFWREGEMKSNQDILDYINHGLDERTASANKKFNYCNTNYAILALIIEKVTGASYAEAMQNILFKPLKMEDTFVFQIQDSAKVSQSYGSGGKRWEWTDLDQIYGDKNIYSTPRDLLRLDKAMYQRDFLSPTLFAEMKKGYSYENPGIKNYGLGMRLMEWEDGETLYYHNGWWHGNYTVYVRDEKNKTTLIALGNKQIRSVYDVFSLAGYFGNYPVGFERLKLNL